MSFNLIHIWFSMGLLSKIIASCLLIMATASIAVVIERYITFWRFRRNTSKFLLSVSEPLNYLQYQDVIEITSSYKLSPLAKMIGAALNKFLENGNVPSIELARREVERQKEEVGNNLRRGMGILASVGSIAPFVGLLGTVVGIINSFQGIAATGSGGLGAVSAGISEALVETALGLIVAIPSVLFFNMISASLNAMESDLSRRTGEFLDFIENNHE